MEHLAHIDVSALRNAGHDAYAPYLKVLQEATGVESLFANMMVQFVGDQGGGDNTMAQVAASLFDKEEDRIEAVQVWDFCSALFCLMAGGGVTEQDDQRAWTMFTTWAMNKTVVGSPHWDLSNIA